VFIRALPDKAVLDRLAIPPGVRSGYAAIQAADATLTFLCIAHRSSNAIGGRLRFNRFTKQRKVRRAG